MPASRARSALGILAGGGTLPIEVAEAVVRDGRPVHIVGIEGEADGAISRYPHTWVNWGGIGGMVAALRDNGCAEIVIVGRVRRPNLIALRPDLGFVASFPNLVRFLWGGDDSVLRRVVRFFEAKGFRVVGVEDVAPHLLAPLGPLGSVVPDASQKASIARAFGAIRALGPFDVGQAVVVAGDRIIAVEGAGGTDQMLDTIEVGTALGSGARAVLVKGPKPGQEMRVDLPTIGPETVSKSAALRLAGIVVPKGRAIVLEREEVARRADAAGMFVAGVESPAESTPEPVVAVTPDDTSDLIVLGRNHPSAEDWKDVALGRLLLVAMKAEGAGYSAVIARQYVLAVEGQEATVAVVRRTGKLKQWGRRLMRRRVGVLVVRDQDNRRSGIESHPPFGPLVEDRVFRAAAEAGIAGIACTESPIPSGLAVDAVRRADAAGLFLVGAKGLGMTSASKGSMVSEVGWGEAEVRPLKLFLVAGEHSGDALGGKLMSALAALHGGPVGFAGVGGGHMEAEGLQSLFPLAEVAVMGPLSILKRLPRIARRIFQVVDAAVAARPDAVVIIDSPEFTHPIAHRIRKRAPDIPIIDYVSPSVWAWRPGRARAMRPYVDHVLGLLPFEPEAHARLDGPPCSYVGHPLVERAEWLRALDPVPLADRLGIAAGEPVLVVLPGSRSSEVGRLMGPFGETIRLLRAQGVAPHLLLPTVPHLKADIERAAALWDAPVHILEGEEDKFRAFKLARAALAASGTVTLELGLAGTPMVVAYKVEPLASLARYLISTETVVLTNLVLGEKAIPELLQENCTPEKLAAALAPLIADTPERARQVAALARVPVRLALSSGTPSEAAARIVLDYAIRGRSAGSG
jgi:lipid-A-disaccharide synthase